MKYWARHQVIILGLAIMAICAWSFVAQDNPQQSLAAYLAAYVFCLAPVLGSMALLLVHALTGGRWGFDLKAPLLAATRVLPLLVLLLLPLLVGAAQLYPWAQGGGIEGLRFEQQRWYLNLPFFVCRAVVCVALWLWLAAGIRRRLCAAGWSQPRVGFAAAGLIVYALSVTVAAVDWIMSLVPDWHSTAFGLIVGTAQILAGGTLAVSCVTTSNTPGMSPEQCGDLGSLLLMLVLAFSYLVFMDYLTAWIADLPSETVWYLPRLATSWRWLGLGLVISGLAIPFAALLWRRVKRDRLHLQRVAALVLASQGGYVIWLILPSLRPLGFSLMASDGLAWLGIGGLCAISFQVQLAQVRLEARAAP